MVGRRFWPHYAEHAQRGIRKDVKWWSCAKLYLERPERKGKSFHHPAVSNAAVLYGAGSRQLPATDARIEIPVQHLTEIRYVL